MHQSIGSSNAPGFTISQEGLKLLACMSMLIDHIGAVFFPSFQWMRIIGRISYPLYAFLLAEGVHYTRNPAKYGLRLLLVAVIAELPYDLLFSGEFTWGKNSVMVTLLFGFAMGVCMKKCPLWGKCLVVLPLAFISRYTGGTYGMYGVLMIAMFLLTRDMPWRVFVQGVLLTLLSLRMAGFPTRLTTQIFAVAAIVPIALYSGKKQCSSKALQWGFTLFYPLHLILFLLIRGA